MIKVCRYRVKNLEGQLNDWARKVNFVWNYCNDVQKHAVRWGRKSPSWFDLTAATAHSSKELGLGANSIGEVCRVFAQSLSQHKRVKYRGRRNLGWVPFRGCDIKILGDRFRLYSRAFRVFDSRHPLEGVKIKDGSSFSQDAKGRWYLNIVVEVAVPETRQAVKPVGIDLGLKDFAALSTGEKIENPRYYCALESRLAIAQRAKHKRQARNIHAKIANRRKDALHKLSHRLTKEFDFIAVGNVNAKALSQTSMAKSVNDVGWSTFRNMLRYKAIAHGATFEEVSEYLSTRVCSSCACETGPKGVADLGIRQWICSECGAVHDRDVNSAINILVRSGHRAPVEGASTLLEMPNHRGRELGKTPNS